MGLKQRTATGKYLKLKDGKFYLSTDKENKESFAEVEGRLVDIYLKDEVYENTPQRKLYLVMNDGDENLIVNVRIDSRYATSFLQFIPNVDLQKPFSIVPVSKEEKGANGEPVTKSSLLISQFGSFVKAYFSKSTPNGLPQMKQVKVNGKMIWDKGEMLEFYENYITNEIKPKLPQAAKTTNASTTILRDEEGVEELQEVNDLPWETD